MLSNIDTNTQGKINPFELDICGKTVVMIGGADGIGRAAAELLSAHAAPIFFAARSQSELKSALAVIAHAEGEVDGMVADLCRPEEAHAFFEQAQNWHGRVDAVVNFLTTASDSEKCQNICTQEALQRMRPGGQIINISSAKRPSAASPLSVQSVAAALRRQACDLGIHVTRIEPDATNTILDEEEIAHCILASLSQPFRVDMIVLPGQAQARVL